MAEVDTSLKNLTDVEIAALGKVIDTLGELTLAESFNVLAQLKKRRSDWFQRGPAKRPGVYHAYEIASDGSFDVGVDVDSDALKIRFDDDVAALKKDYPDEDYSYRLGTVAAETPEQAMNKIRAGRWDYTEVL
jgi:hypothetical protein